MLNRPAFLDAKNLQPFINEDLEGVLNTVSYSTKNSAIVEGYDVTILTKHL